MFRKTVLDNGLRIVSEKMPYVRSVSIGMWVDLGARDERRAENGICHFIEHMVFKGTRRRTALDIALSLESLGGSLNAYTGREQTCYYARVLDQHAGMAVDVLCDILSNSLFDDEHCRMERRVILEEIKDVHDTPSDLVHDLFSMATWKDQALGFPILGSATTVKQFDRRKVVTFFKRHYRAGRMVIAAAGNVNHADLVEQIRRQLVLGEGRRGVRRNGARPTCYAARRVHTRDIKQAHVVVGWENIRYDHPDRYPLLMLNSTLGGGMSSRLFQLIRENLGLAYSVFSFQDFYRDTGLFGAYLGCDASKAVEAVNRLIAEISKVKRDGITDAEFASAKLQMAGNLMLGLESSTNRMNRIARNELYLGEYIDLDSAVKGIEKVKKADLTRVAREYLNPEQGSMVMLGPLDKGVFSRLDL